MDAFPVELIEVGPRDGLQNESAPVTTALKLELVNRLLDAGLRRIEVCSFVHPGKVPQMADAEVLCAALPHRLDTRYAGLVLNLRGYERALATGRLHEAALVVPATDTFGRRNQGQSTAEALAEAQAIALRAPGDGLPWSATIAVAFGCPFEGDVAVEIVAGIAQKLAALGPQEIVLADTIGVAVPGQVEQLAAAVLTATGGSVPLRGHFHDTRNTGVANVYAGLRAGLRRFDASLGGLGGCPFAPAATGNVATEDLVYLCERMGLRTGVDLEKAIAASRWLGTQLGKSLPGMLSRAGPFPRRQAAAGASQ